MEKKRMPLQHKIIFGYIILVAVIGSMIAILIYERRQMREVEGSVAQDVKKDTFVRIMVAGFRAKYIGRGSGGETGTFTIWEDGARRQWLEDK